MKPYSKVEHTDEKDNPYTSMGYVRLPEAPEVMRRVETNKRASKPSPLLEEYMNKQSQTK